MGKFSRIKKHRKLSSTLSIDEKIEFLNKEMKKTGVLSEKMTTSDMYTKTSFTPYIPATWDEVPDSSGITGDGWTQPGDETDSSTYDVDDFENSLCKELISVEMKTGGSVGKFLHNQIKEGLIVESK